MLGNRRLAKIVLSTEVRQRYRNRLSQSLVARHRERQQLRTVLMDDLLKRQKTTASNIVTVSTPTTGGPPPPIDSVPLSAIETYEANVGYPNLITFNDETITFNDEFNITTRVEEMNSVYFDNFASYNLSSGYNGSELTNYIYRKNDIISGITIGEL